MIELILVGNMNRQYFIQDKNDWENYLVKKFLDENDNYTFSTTDMVKNIRIYNDIIPIGDIDFVAAALNRRYPFFKKQVPIEVPVYLQDQKYLNRIYKVGTWKDIPKTGKWFIKDASELKAFSICENMDFWYNEEYFDYQPKTSYDATISLPTDHDYIISSPVNILAEYRVYVINRVIKNICFYKGRVDIFPDSNTSDMIKEMVNIINDNEKYLKSYALDVMITADGKTSIIELHNFSSIGLYMSSPALDKSLLLGYEQGIDYLLNDNSIKYKET